MNFRPQHLLQILFSIGLASLLWFLVSAEERSEIILSVPLEYRNLPHGTEILSAGDMLTKVNVWVRGATASIKNLQPNEIRAWVDLSATGTGDRIFELSSSNVQVPYDFTVLKITPSQIRLRIEEIVTRKVPVIPHLEGKPPEGFALVGTFVTPPQVEIVGPRSAVDAIKHVITDSINLSNLKSEFVTKANVGVEDSAVRLGKTKEVVVSLRVSEIQDILTIRRVPITAAGPKVSFSPRIVRVDLQAAKPVLKQLNQDEIHGVLDLNGLKPGSYELTPKIVGFDADLKISVVAILPERIHVEIEK